MEFGYFYREGDDATVYAEVLTPDKQRDMAIHDSMAVDGMRMRGHVPAVLYVRGEEVAVGVVPATAIPLTLDSFVALRDQDWPPQYHEPPKPSIGHVGEVSMEGGLGLQVTRADGTVEPPQ